MAFSKRLSVRCGVIALFMIYAAMAFPKSGGADTITFLAPSIGLLGPIGPGPNGDGYFDIWIINTKNDNTAANLQGGGTVNSLNTDGSDTITGFQIEIEAGAGLTFVAASDQTQSLAPNAATYLFSSNSLLDPSFDNSNSSIAVSSQNYSLTDFAADQGTVLTDGTPLGLIRIEYSFIPGFAGVVPLTIVDANQDSTYGSFFMDSQGNVDIPTIINGAIAVPEPAGWVLAALGLLAILSGFLARWSPARNPATFPAQTFGRGARQRTESFPDWGELEWTRWLQGHSACHQFDADLFGGLSQRFVQRG